MSQESSDSELNDIESALLGLVPVPSRVDRDALMFQAGSASALPAARGRWVWPSIAATLAVALVSESLVMAVRRGPRMIERIVVVREPALPTTTSPTSDAGVPRSTPPGSLSNRRDSDTPSLASSWPVTSEYQRIQELVLRFGLDALPERASPLASRSDRTVDPVDRPVPSAGHLRRLELEKLLNLEPGGPS
jgi:hypothetical protein